MILPTELAGFQVATLSTGTAVPDFSPLCFNSTQCLQHGIIISLADLSNRSHVSLLSRRNVFMNCPLNLCARCALSEMKAVKHGAWCSANGLNFIKKKELLLLIRWLAQRRNISARLLFKSGHRQGVYRKNVPTGRSSVVCDGRGSGASRGLQPHWTKARLYRHRACLLVEQANIQCAPLDRKTLTMAVLSTGQT